MSNVPQQPRSRSRYRLRVALAVLFGLVGNASAETFLYWTETDRSGTDPNNRTVSTSIMRCRLDGTGVEAVLTDTSISDGGITQGFGGIAFDPVNGHIYSGDKDHLFRVDLDGSNRVDLVSTPMVWWAGVADVEIDLVNNKVYWSELGPNEIWRANLDGSFPDLLTGSGWYAGSEGIAIDPLAGKVYFSYATNETTQLIEVMDLNGDNRTVFKTLNDNAVPFDVDIDLLGGELYWSETARGIPANQAIRKTSLDGAGAIEDVVAPPPQGTGGGIHYDVASNQIYNHNNAASHIDRLNPDGSGYEVVITRPDDIVINYMAVIEIGPTNNPPVADAGPDQIVECESLAGTLVTLDGTSSSDPDDDAIEYAWLVPDGVELDDPNGAAPMGLFPLGPTLVTLTVTDGKGGVSSDDVLITVEDTTPPVVVCTTDPGSLWPANHKMVPVMVSVVASDVCENPDALSVDCSISSNEPDDATGDGAFIGDVDGEDGFSAPVEVSLVYIPDTASYEGVVLLRAERNGAEEGRVYSIVCNVEDEPGNSSTSSCVVIVPHDRRKK